MSLTAIIIDDEIHCQNTLRQLLAWACPEIQIIDVCTAPEAGILSIDKHRPDIVFLDIEMPGMTGFELLHQLDQINFDIIFTTAYDQYAIAAFKESATAYLLKPIDEESLRAAVDQLIQRRSQTQSFDHLFTLFRQLQVTGTTDKVSFPTAEGLEFISWKHIIRCEADSNYTKIYITERRPLLISKTLKETESLIAQPKVFIRPHASHLINLNYIRTYLKGSGGQIIMDDNSIIPVSKSRKEGFMDAI